MQKNTPKQPVMFADVCSDVTSELKTALERMNRHDVASQLDRVKVLSQMLSGTPEHFRFAAEPIPRLTYEEAMATQMRDWENLRIPLRGGSITLALDDFGLVNFIYVKGLQDVYTALKALKGYISTEEDLPAHLRERQEAERSAERESANNRGIETGWGD